MTDFGEQVTLHSRGVTGQDSYGNDIRADVDTYIKCLAFDPGGSIEVTQGGDRVISQPIVYLPPRADVTATAAVTVRGVRYEVDGQPAAPVSPWTGWAPGVIVRLKGMTG